MTDAIPVQIADMFAKIDRIERMVSDRMGEPYHVDQIGNLVMIGKPDEEHCVAISAHELEVSTDAEFTDNAVSVLRILTNRAQHPDSTAPQPELHP